MATKKIRYQVFVDEDMAEKIETFCRQARITKSSLINKAVIANFEQRGETEIDQRYCKRLDKLSDDLERLRSVLELPRRDLEHIQRDVEMILESLALFIRFSIAINAYMPMPDKATMAVAHERYLRFVDQVGHQIARGRSSSGVADPKGSA